MRFQSFVQKSAQAPKCLQDTLRLRKFEFWEHDKKAPVFDFKLQEFSHLVKILDFRVTLMEDNVKLVFGWIFDRISRNFFLGYQRSVERWAKERWVKLDSANYKNKMKSFLTSRQLPATQFAFIFLSVIQKCLNVFFFFSHKKMEI